MSVCEDTLQIIEKKEIINKYIAESHCHNFQ